MDITSVTQDESASRDAAYHLCDSKASTSNSTLGVNHITMLTFYSTKATK